MSRKGNCLDNTMAENCFGIMRSELLYVEKFESVEDFVKTLEEYIEYYSNIYCYDLITPPYQFTYRSLFVWRKDCSTKYAGNSNWRIYSENSSKIP